MAVSVNRHGLINIHLVSLKGILPDEVAAVMVPTPSGAKQDNQPTQIPSDVLAGKKLSGKDPMYPLAAKANREEGLVIIGATINRTGDIENARVFESPSSSLGNAALDAVRTWKYEPYLRDGKAIAVETTVSVVYRLGK